MAGFGWSAGDLVAAISVVMKVCKALKDAGGAKEDYRESVAFLESLSVTLEVLHKYYEANLNQKDLSDVKAQILLIQDPIDAFTKNVKLKYGFELGTQPGIGYRTAVKGVSKKIKWALWMHKESERLNSRISTPLAAIQMRLSIQITSIVSTIPGDVSKKIEGVMRTAIPALIEQSLAPLKAFAEKNRMDQLTSNSMIQQKLDILPKILASRLEPEMDAIRRRDDQRGRELDEHHESLSKKVVWMEDRLQQEISTYYLESSSAADAIIREFRILSETTLLNNSLLDKKLETIQKQLYHREENSNPGRGGINALASRKRTIVNDNALLKRVEATASGLIESHSTSYLAEDAGNNPWREAGDHFQEFIRLLLQGFYKLFIRLWPLFASFLVQLKIMRQCIVRLPSLLSEEDITFIDVLGNPKRLPYSTYGHWEIFNKFLRVHYKNMPGESQILARRYTITSQDGHMLNESTWLKYAQPKAVISMTVVLTFSALGNRCPKCARPVNENNTLEAGILITCPNRECLLEFRTINQEKLLSTTHVQKMRLSELAFSSSLVKQNTRVSGLSVPFVPISSFPIWLEVARSLKKVEYANMRAKADAISPSSPDTPDPPNIHFTSDGPEPYRHLLHAEKIEFPNKQTSEIHNFTQIVSSRKRELADLEQYFKRVHCVSESLPPCSICSFAEYRYPDDVERHMLLQHSRIYSCIFDFGGCKESFTDRAQWICHIESRHLNWLCHHEECPNEEIDAMNHYHGTFLFFTMKQRAAKLAIRKQRASELLRVSLRTPKQAPVRLGCPLKGCEKLFGGDECWNKRLDHIGTHARENATLVAGYFCGKLSVDHSDDGAFIDWALSERIVRRVGKGFRLVVP
ncbi:hypothetical protein EAF04_007440 [Stromatinia cepivora]|nr:hypothetical protein EAF04_007440 [Stromatinia cepivora]